MLTSIVPDRARLPLAAAVAPFLALSASTTCATTFVTNCNDTGPGSLRAAVAAAIEGDTVDATALTTASAGCARSRITLKTGDIVVNKNNLTISGPGTDFIVTAKYDNGMGTQHQYYNRLFTHTGNGTLLIRNLSLIEGYLAGIDELGGCINSRGNVTLNHVNVAFCSAKLTASGPRTHAQRANAAWGGGVFSYGSLTLLYSTLSFNMANGDSFGPSVGGGAMVNGDFYSRYSSINSNYSAGYGGGVGLTGPVTTLRNTTVAGNHAMRNSGGIDLEFGGGPKTLTLVNSTISGNRADAKFGAMYAIVDSFHSFNSTLAFNVAGTSSAGLGLKGGGGSAVLQSTLISNNTYGSPATSYDLSIAGFVTTGANNLVRVSSGSLPADTIVGKCPLLAPLRANGGLTLTHALLGHSPAMEAGNNLQGLEFDQRGSAAANGVRDYPRVSGPPGGPAAADIGAFEVDRSDKVFDANFEGCP